MMIFAFVFLGAFVAIIGLTPAELVSAGKEYSAFGSDVPDVWNGINLLAYNFTGAWNFTLSASASGTEYFDVGGRNLALDWLHGFGTGRLRLSHRYGFGLLWHEDMNWYNKEGFQKSWESYGLGQIITTAELDEDYEAHDSIQFTVVCLGLGSGSSYFKVTALLAFNETAYTSPSNAWDDSHLDILVGIEFSDANTAMNAWYLMTQLLTFNTVEIFGTATPEAVALNLLMALPFYASIGFIATAIILEILPF
jgi:hypothetical protein